jgi:predicted RNase H-like HicB family nuclease
MSRYLIVIEPTATGFSASPDLSGCVSKGGTREEVERNMREAIEFQITAPNAGIPLRFQCCWIC